MQVTKNFKLSELEFSDSILLKLVANAESGLNKYLDFNFVHYNIKGTKTKWSN